MRYRISHRTDYAYDAPVHESFNEVRLRPASDDTQTCLKFELRIDPPATVVSFTDYYGNAVHDFSVPYLHDHLSVEARSDVVTFAHESEPLAGPRDGEADRSPGIAGLAADPLFSDEHSEFLAPSSYVSMRDASAGISRDLLALDPSASAYAFLRAATAHVRERLHYRVGATTVQSRVEEVLAGGSGVCQDFSHLLISLCRLAGLPARYVSGYLGDVRESEASHAWVEAYVPPYGWVGVDPTSGGVCTGRHVRLAVGRDYADVTVVRGTYRGGTAALLAVTVRTEPVVDVLGIAVGHERRRGELVQFQTLGAMRQRQRLGAMSQSMGGMTQTIGTDRHSETDQPAGMRHPEGEGEAPRQQPQQQQQQQQQTATPEVAERSAVHHAALSPAMNGLAQGRRRALRAEHGADRGVVGGRHVSPSPSGPGEVARRRRSQERDGEGAGGRGLPLATDASRETRARDLPADGTNGAPDPRLDQLHP